MTVTRREFAYGLLTNLFSSDSLQAAFDILDKATSPGWFSPRAINAAVLHVCYKNEHFTRAYGLAGTPDRVFPIASISKPIVASGAMVLVDRGMLSLNERASRMLPEFSRDGRDEITVQNLLTHTAGLPDMLPQMHQLMSRGAGLEQMFAATCKVPLLFKPGTTVSYSNLGVLVLKEMMERITGVPLSIFLEKEIFKPLSMTASSLGLGGRLFESMPQLQHYGNSDNPHLVRRDLASPWGGVHSTAADLTRFLQYFMNPTNSPLKVETTRNMTCNHCEGLNQPWGIGWMLDTSHDVYYRVRPTWSRYGLLAFVSNPEHGPAFGSYCSLSTFGHYGVSGTIAWADPIRNLSMVLLTTKFVRFSRDGVLGPVSDLISKL